MKTKKTITLCLFINLFALSLFAQKANIIVEDDDPTPILYEWMGTGSKLITKKGMVYEKPKKFKETSMECFEDYLHLFHTFKCIGPSLTSNDGQYISFMVNHNIEDKAYHERMKKLFRNIPNLEDIQHRNQLKGTLVYYYGESISDSWQDSLTYFTDEQAKNICNADTIITTSITLKPEDYYKKDFKHIEIYLMQKKGRGYVYFVSFYTDKAKKKLKHYRKAIAGALRYED